MNASNFIAVATKLRSFYTWFSDFQYQPEVHPISIIQDWKQAKLCALISNTGFSEKKKVEQTNVIKMIIDYGENHYNIILYKFHSNK